MLRRGLILLSLIAATALCGCGKKMHEAAKNGNVDAVRAQLRRGAKIERRDAEGKTPLHWAAQNGHIEVVKLLIEAGADINNKSIVGRTPLDDTMDTEMFKLLVMHDAKLGSE